MFTSWRCIPLQRCWEKSKNKKKEKNNHKYITSSTKCIQKLKIHHSDVCNFDVPISFFTTWIFRSLRSSLLHQTSYYKIQSCNLHFPFTRSHLIREKKKKGGKWKERKNTKDRRFTKSIMIVKGWSRKNTIISLAFSTPQGTLKPNSRSKEEKRRGEDNEVNDEFSTNGNRASWVCEMYK